MTDPDSGADPATVQVVLNWFKSCGRRPRSHDNGIVVRKSLPRFPPRQSLARHARHLTGMTTQSPLWSADPNCRCGSHSQRPSPDYFRHVAKGFSIEQSLTLAQKRSKRFKLRRGSQSGMKPEETYLNRGAYQS